MKNMKIIFLILLLLCLSYPYSLAQSKIGLEKPVWDLGRVSKGEVIEKIFRIKNTGKDKLIIKKVRPGCDCISLYILKGEAEKNGCAEVKAVFDTKKDVKDKFTKYFYIQSNDNNKPVIRVTITGILEKGKVNIGKKKKDAGLAEPITNEGARVEIILFYTPGCRGCKKVKDVFLQKLCDKYKGELEIKGYDITILENYLKLIDLEEEYKVKESDPIIVFAGEKYFSGKNAILKCLEPYIIDLLKTEKRFDYNLTEVKKAGLLNRFKSFSPLIIFSAGFIDGINPCAFVTIVFLMSFLYFSEKTRKEVILIGLVFSLAVFLAYLLLGIGFFCIFRRLFLFSFISNIIYIIAIGFLFLLAYFSICDAFIYYRYGHSGRMKLKLPVFARRKVHDIIRRSFGTKRLVIGVFSAGFLVSILESICTGQVYLPTIMFMVKEYPIKRLCLLYLLLYNTAFIVPLIMIFVLTILGVSSGKLANFSKRNIILSKILLFVLFLTLGIFMLIAL